MMCKEILLEKTKAYHETSVSKQVYEIKKKDHPPLLASRC